MEKYFVVAFVFFGMNSGAQEKALRDNCSKPKVLSLASLLTLQSASRIPQSTREEATEKQGCCSHHSGVCGCSFGVVTCCDGSSSPSCRCD